MTSLPPSPTPAEWDAFVRAQPRAHALQQWAWGELKAAFGWGVERITLWDDSQTQLLAAAQILFRPLPYRLGSMAYLPFGPIFSHQPSAPSTVYSVLSLCHAAARRRGAAFLKWEPGLFAAGDAPPNPAMFGFRPSPQTIQPPRTILIDITGTDEAILARMNQGTRRKIRQSLKNDIRYVEAGPAEVARFTAMMTTTGSRNAFGVHDPAYYQRAFDLFVPPGHAALLLAEHEGTPLAGVMVFAAGRTAWYLYGASSDEKRNLMGSYGAQWAAIQWAQARGCTTYDLWGIPDEDEAVLEAQFEQRSDGLWGVYGFKRGWGGQVARSLGAWDYVYNPLVYAAYRLALRRRRVAES